MIDILRTGMSNIFLSDRYNSNVKSTPPITHYWLIYYSENTNINISSYFDPSPYLNDKNRSFLDTPRVNLSLNLLLLSVQYSFLTLVPLWKSDVHNISSTKNILYWIFIHQELISVEKKCVFARVCLCIVKEWI